MPFVDPREDALIREEVEFAVGLRFLELIEVDLGI